jgi:hypothetical protein
MYKNGIPQFDGQNYTLCSRRMKTYVEEHVFYVWKSVVDGYKESATPSINNNGNKLIQKNSRDKNDILNVLVDTIYVKVMSCDSAKDIWDKLQNFYEGDVKFKETKL